MTASPAHLLAPGSSRPLPQWPCQAPLPGRKGAADRMETGPCPSQAGRDLQRIKMIREIIVIMALMTMRMLMKTTSWLSYLLGSQVAAYLDLSLARR